MEVKLIGLEEMRKEPYRSQIVGVQQAFLSSVQLSIENGVREDVLKFLSANADNIIDDIDFSMILSGLIEKKADVEWVEYVMAEFQDWDEKSIYTEIVQMALQNNMRPETLKSIIDENKDIYKIFEVVESYGIVSENGQQSLSETGEEDKQQMLPETGMQDALTETSNDAGESAEGGLGNMENSQGAGYCMKLQEDGMGMYGQYLDAMVAEKRDDTKLIRQLKNTFDTARQYLDDIISVNQAENDRVKSLERVNMIQRSHIAGLTRKISMMQQEMASMREQLNEAAQNVLRSESITQKLKEITSLQESMKNPLQAGYMLEDDRHGA